MNTIIRFTLRVVMLAAGLWLLSTGVASAQSADTSLLTGPVVNLDVDAPVNVCGTTVAALADTATNCGQSPAAPASAPAAPAPEATAPPTVTNPVDAIIAADVDVPVNVCGIDVTVIGSSNTNCSAPAPQPAPAPSDQATPPNSGLIDLDIPIDICGINVTALGTNNTNCGPVEEPVTPVTPVTPETLVTPVTPVTPETPVTPVTPVTPESPVTPVSPVEAVTPEAPATSPVPSTDAPVFLAGRPSPISAPTTPQRATDPVLRGDLPRTGSPLSILTQIGLLLLAAGAAIRFANRGRQADTT